MRSSVIGLMAVGFAAPACLHSGRCRLLYRSADRSEILRGIRRDDARI